MKNVFSVNGFVIALFILNVLQSTAFAGDKIKVAATSTTLASIVREIAGERAEIYAVASPKRNIHFYQPTPKDVLKVKKADIFVHEGLDLELWRDPMLHAAGNQRFFGASEFSIDASKDVPLLEVPTMISRAEGDIHVYGNPHYWTDPENMKVIASNIGGGLARAYPEYRDEFLKNTDQFRQKLNQKMAEWEGRLEPYRGMAVVAYHRSWIYFTERFGFESAGELEPKPGIPPTAKHIAGLIKTMKEKDVKLVIKETFSESRTPDKVARETGAKVLTLLQATGAAQEAQDYISMMEYNVRAIETALANTKEKVRG